MACSQIPWPIKIVHGKLRVTVPRTTLKLSEAGKATLRKKSHAVSLFEYQVSQMSEDRQDFRHQFLEKPYPKSDKLRKLHFHDP